ncbi:MAG TPA: MoaD/ThiS family protein [Steroidobacter sp.]|nr:MoaD/ThiS family protein [Steroidobacter sp.]
MINSNVCLLDLPDAQALDNVNTREEFRAASDKLSGAGASAPSRAAETGSSIPAVRKTVRVQYFAVLREQAGRSDETLDTAAATPAELYEELRAQRGFQLAASQLKVALNADFSDWRAPLRHGDVVVFIPPVAGG